MHIVELEKGVWLAEGEGDPARTLRKENAKNFKDEKEAAVALEEARSFRPFINAKTEAVKKAFRIEVRGHETTIVGAETASKAKAYVMGVLEDIGYSTKWNDIKSVKRSPEYDAAVRDHKTGTFCKGIEGAELARMASLPWPKVAERSHEALLQLAKMIQETYGVSKFPMDPWDLGNRMGIHMDWKRGSFPDNGYAQWSRNESGKHSLKVAIDSFDDPTKKWKMSLGLSFMLLDVTKGAMDSTLHNWDKLDRYETTVRLASYLMDPEGLCWKKDISHEEVFKKTHIPEKVMALLHAPLFDGYYGADGVDGEEQSLTPGHQLNLDFYHGR